MSKVTINMSDVVRSIEQLQSEKEELFKQAESLNAEGNRIDDVYRSKVAEAEAERIKARHTLSKRHSAVLKKMAAVDDSLTSLINTRIVDTKA